jgi:hypothetical protein
MAIETDYLVIGAGASGLAFADSLIAEDREAEVTLVDRRPGPGGHWLDAYPFVRLHTPSAYYGVNSMVLGDDRIDEDGENAGLYERATGAEVRDYFSEVGERLEQTGQVQILTGHESDEDRGTVRDLGGGDTHEVNVRRKVVDARYLEASIPATHTPSFEVADGANLIPVNKLPEAVTAGARYTVLGAGKTAVDACTWLLANDVAPDQVRWVRPRDMWFNHRRHFQPLELVGGIMVGTSLDAAAAAAAGDVDELFNRLEEFDRLVRIDPSAPATMYRQTMLGPAELEAARQIDDVVRLGRVRRFNPDRLVLERGEIDVGPGDVVVDCTAAGLRNASATPIFQEGRIVIQQVRQNSPTFNSALVGFVESHRDDDVEKNRLCPPNPYANSIEDWPGLTRRTWQVEQRWLSEPDLAGWIAESRVNIMRGLPDHAGEPHVKEAMKRFLTHVGPATERLRQLDA